MKRSTILSSLTLASALIMGGILLAPSFASEHRGASGGERNWLSIRQVHDKLEAAGYRNIEKIEREHGGYEARATDRNGTRIKLYINPQSGEVADRNDRRSDDKRAKASREERQGSTADCNERRCRDDLPPKSGTSLPTPTAPVN